MRINWLDPYASRRGPWDCQVFCQRGLGACSPAQVPNRDLSALTRLVISTTIQKVAELDRSTMATWRLPPGKHTKSY